MKSILFLFNQIISPTISSGGDIKSLEIINRAHGSGRFKISVIAPYFSQKSFSNHSFLSTGKTKLEKLLFNQNRVASFLPTYILRTIEACSILLTKRFNIYYTTGDFFCNVVPVFLFKRKGMWAACIYHLNEPPWKRKNYWFRGVLSYVLQNISLYLIKKRAALIFVLNQGIKEQLEAKGFSQTIVVSYAGLNLNQTQKVIGVLPQKKVGSNLVFFNRVNPTKGIGDLAFITNQVKLVFPKLRLDIFGSIDPQTKKILSQDFKKYSCSNNSNIHGYVQQKQEIYEALKVAKVFMQPSYEEGWSIVLFEAILCKCIPVVYDLPVYREIFGDLLPTAPLGNKNNFSQEVIKILQLSCNNYFALANKLQQVALRYDWNKVFEIELQALEAFSK